MGASLQTGWLPWTVMVLGIVGGIYLLGRNERWWWIYVVPSVAIVSALAAYLIGTTVAEDLFAAPLKATDIIWIGVAIAAVGLCIGFMVKTVWWRKVVAVVAAIFVVAAAGNQINKSFSQFPTLGDLFGVSSDGQISGPPVVPTGPSTNPLPAGPLASAWTPTGPNIPEDGKGKVSQINIPGTASGYQPRESWVYYPPAYFAENLEPLPVLVLMHGQPGEPGDWLLGSRLQDVMDAYAAQHKGIAPVVVLPDVTGSQLGNPLCVDSSLGNIDTYLSVDVPNAIRSQLAVDPNPAHWAIGGFSYGGTCSLQMATNHPDIYPTFIDVSGELEPSLGDHQKTVSTAFGGDEAKFKAINPMDIMATKKFPNSAGWFVAGSEDPDFVASANKTYEAAKAAGMDVQLWIFPGGGHDWTTPVAALDHTLPWLGQRLNLTG